MAEGGEGDHPLQRLRGGGVEVHELLRLRRQAGRAARGKVAAPHAEGAHVGGERGLRAELGASRRSTLSSEDTASRALS